MSMCLNLLSAAQSGKNNPITLNISMAESNIFFTDHKKYVDQGKIMLTFQI